MISLNMIVIVELGGYKRNRRHTESRGNAAHWHTNQVCGHSGGVEAPVWPPVERRQPICQCNTPWLWQLSAGRAVRREHHDSTGSPWELRVRESGRGRLGLLPLQPPVSGEGRPLLLQRVLHLERLPPGLLRHSRGPREPLHNALPNRFNVYLISVVMVLNWPYPGNYIFSTTLQLI